MSKKQLTYVRNNEIISLVIFHHLTKDTRY